MGLVQNVTFYRRGRKRLLPSQPDSKEIELSNVIAGIPNRPGSGKAR
jgi:hypothetical protein